MTGEAEVLERQRILLLLHRNKGRDGRAAARAWVERTRRLYAEAIATSHSHASLPQYRPEFEASIRVFDAWLANPHQIETATAHDHMEFPS
ncbi:MAG TPA: hypothetical protein VFH57_02600 [Gammaproteobacteria bacterium]|nr:hypothetical protein [Gammaproteobacteria bacterium]